MFWDVFLSSLGLIIFIILVGQGIAALLSSYKENE